MTTIKPADKTTRWTLGRKRAKTHNKEKASLAQRGERERGRGKEGKGQWCCSCFLPSDLLNSSNHSDRRRAREGESEPGKTVKFGLMEGAKEAKERGKRSGGRPAREREREAQIDVLARRAKKTELKIEAEQVIWSIHGSPN